MTTDAIPAPLKQVVELFNGDLADVSFPNVDRFALEDLQMEANACHEELVEARAMMESAQQTFEAAVDRLRQRAIKGIAYARIFADGNAELIDQLDGLLLVQKQQEKARPRRKPRRRKPQPAEVAELPLKQAQVTLEAVAEPAA